MSKLDGKGLTRRFAPKLMLYFNSNLVATPSSLW